MPQQLIKIYKIFSLQIILSYNKEACNNFFYLELPTKEKIKSLTINKRAGKRDNKNKTANVPAPFFMIKIWVNNRRYSSK
jgi:hypothetical protein